MKDTQLGTVPDADAKRDAVHVAVCPAIAAHPIFPGTRVGIVGWSGETPIVGVDAYVKIGTVDPFLSTPVDANDRCYVCLFPDTVTSLRHEWTHPLFGRPTIDSGFKTEMEA